MNKGKRTYQSKKKMKQITMTTKVKRREREKRKLKKRIQKQNSGRRGCHQSFEGGTWSRDPRGCRRGNSSVWLCLEWSLPAKG
jgi:hypothetical protein